MDLQEPDLGDQQAGDTEVPFGPGLPDFAPGIRAREAEGGRYTLEAFNSASCPMFNV
jgi:hypothetical protein